MHFLAPILFLSTLASSIPIASRAVGTVLADLQAIREDVATLNSAALTYNGNIFASLGLVIAVNELKAALAKATTDTTSSTAFNDAESTSIVNSVTTLTPNIVTLLSNLNAKASVVATAGFTSLVNTNLIELRDDSNELFDAIEVKVTPAAAVSIASSQAAVSAAFATSLTIFLP